MSPRGRQILFVIAALVFLGLLGGGLEGLAPFGAFAGRYGELLNGVAVPERHVLNVVSAVIFDYRGFDTLGEEFILFASITGVVLLLRNERAVERSHAAAPRDGSMAEPRPGDALRLSATTMAAVVWLFGAYVAFTGHLSVGGGFQAGAILSAAWVLVYVAYGREALDRVAPTNRLEWGEAFGAGGYVVLGLLGLAAGEPYLANVLPLGTAGNLFSSGTILTLNLLVAVEVASGFVLLLVEFAKPLSPGGDGR